MDQKKDLSVIISFKNEEENIIELINRLENCLNAIKINYEIIFIDDKSTDNSKEIIISSINKNKNIKYILLSRTFGIGPGIIAGLENTDAEASVYIDCDLQDPPELIPKMYNLFKEGNDVVHTQRISRAGESFLKLLLTKFAYKFLNKITKPKVIVESGDFRLLSKRARENVLKLKERDPFIRNLSQWIGFKQTKIQYDRDARSRGKTNFSLLNSTAPYLELIRGITSFSSALVHINIFISIICLVVSFIGLTFYPSDNLINLLFLLFSFVFFGIWTIGIYVLRILEQTNSRPTYIIEEKIGF